MSADTGRNPARAIEVIGLGMGSGLSRGEMERIVSADVLAGGRRLLERFGHMPGERIVLASPLENALDAIENAWNNGKRVAVLADGDPLFFGIGARLVDRFGRENLSFTPGLCAVQAACARMGLAWDDLPVVSLHGRNDDGPLFAALAAKGRAAVYTDHENTPGRLAVLLIERGLEKARIWVAENLGSPGERVRGFSPGQAVREDFSALNIAVIEGAYAPEGPPQLGRAEEFYAKEEGLITKWPVRACALASLRLGPGGVLWDVGAGCGAVSIEACALMPRGKVFAVERDPARCGFIRQNIRRSGAWQVKTIEGEAPEAFKGLDDPDRVFLGGSLGSGAGALSEASRRLRPGGRVVVNTVLLGSLNTACEHFRVLGWECRISQIQASHGSPLAGDVRLGAQNPVFIITADKPE